jgi:hypothetical protein
MPTMRRMRRRKVLVQYDDDTVRVHLEVGDCLLAGAGKGCGCGLVDEHGELRESAARAAWKAWRQRILRDWTAKTRPWGAQFDDDD